MLTWQELWSYLRTVLRWWPLLLLSAALSIGGAAVLVRQQPSYYKARASLMVGNNFEVAAPERSSVDVSNSLARYYEVLVRREVIMRPAAEQLQLPFRWQLIERMLATEINPQANLLEIVIIDSDPQRAAAIANALADQLIVYSPNAPEKVAAQRAEVERQITENQAALDTTERRLAELHERQSQLNAAVDLRENQEQIDELEKARERYQSTYASLLALQNNASVNSLAYFERAAPPTEPLPTKTLAIIGGAGLAGLLLGCLSALVLDLLDNRWRPDGDHWRRLGIRTLGGVHYEGSGARTQGHERALREAHAQLVLSTNGHPPRALLVSSPRPSQARSEFALDLAGLFGQAGHTVLLVDAELVQPHISRLIRQRVTVTPPHQNGSIMPWADPGAGHQIPSKLRGRLQATHIANVMLLPGKAQDDGHPVLVPLLHWPDLVSHLRSAADIVIFDGPSALTGADAALLAPLVDGVVLALSPAETTRSELEELKARLLHSPEARLLGAVSVTVERPRRTRRRGSFAVSVGRDGVTITLPTRQPEPALLTRAKEGAENVAAAPAGQGDTEYVPRDPMLDELLGQRDESGEQAWAVGGHERVIITPTTRVIVTPPPAAETTRAAPRRRSGRSRGARQRYRAAPRGVPQAAEDTTEEQP